MQLNERFRRQTVAMQSMNLFSSPWHVPRGEKEGGVIRFQMPRPRILVEQKEDKVVFTVQHTY